MSENAPAGAPLLGVEVPVETPVRDSLVRFRGDRVDPAPEEVAGGCAGVAAAVADTLHAAQPDDAPAAVRDDSGSDEDAAAAAAAAAAVAAEAVAAAAAASKADDGTTEVAPSSCSGCSADDTDDYPGAAAADEPSFLRIDSAAAAAAAAVPLVEADSGLGQSLASGCFAVVVPYFAVADVDGVVAAAAGAADTVPDAAGDDAAAAVGDGDCHPSDLHQDPCPAGASAVAAAAAAAAVRPAVTAQSPAAAQSAVESASGPSHPVHSSTASPTCRCPCCAYPEPSAVGAFPGPSSSPLYSWCSLAV